MKEREGFVSNSSSTLFVITNKTDHVVDLVLFVEENPRLVVQFNQIYDGNYRNADLVEEAKNKNITWEPNERKTCEFGDHAGPYSDTSIGEVYDTILRHGGESRSFKWKFLELNR
nr:hypothetical protein [Candidatus Sigynarchaeota archaeon]